MQEPSKKFEMLGEEPMHWCLGCKCFHLIHINKPNPHTGAKWYFNGDFDKPSFSPSIHIKRASGITECHYFIKDGMIQYLNDCLHPYAGKTIEIPDIPPGA